MSHTQRIAACVAGLSSLAAFAGLTLGASATAATSPSQDVGSSRIVGGRPQSSEWVVQLEFGDGRNTYGCTGNAVSPHWVLTAKHCIDGTRWMNVYYSNSTSQRGQAVQVDRLLGSPSGDVALVHLSQSKPVGKYARLTGGYTPRAGGTGSIAGYGLRADKQRASRLFSADVTILGASLDAYDGPAVHVRGIDGASNHGDSGGPLLVDGDLVGVCSTGDSADPGSNTRAGSNYANISRARSWIRSIAGV